jgi:predicted transcriptional regulator
MRKAFTQIQNSIVRCPTLSNSEFRVLIVLMSIDPCYPSHLDIAKWTGLTKNTVNKTLQALKRKNIISWKKGHGFGNNNHYKIHPQKVWLNHPKNWVSTTPKIGDLKILIRELELPMNEKDLELASMTDEEIMELFNQRKTALE